MKNTFITADLISLNIGITALAQGFAPRATVYLLTAKGEKQ
jgi:hypothetical protein